MFSRWYRFYIGYKADLKLDLNDMFSHPSKIRGFMPAKALIAGLLIATLLASIPTDVLIWSNILLDPHGSIAQDFTNGSGRLVATATLMALGVSLSFLKWFGRIYFGILELGIAVGFCIFTVSHFNPDNQASFISIIGIVLLVVKACDDIKEGVKLRRANLEEESQNDSAA